MGRQHDEDYWSNHQDWDHHGPITPEWRAIVLEQEERKRRAFVEYERKMYAPVKAHPDGSRECPVCRGKEIVSAHPGEARMMVCYRCDGEGVV